MIIYSLTASGPVVLPPTPSLSLACRRLSGIVERTQAMESGPHSTAGSHCDLSVSFNLCEQRVLPHGGGQGGGAGPKPKPLSLPPSPPGPLLSYPNPRRSPSLSVTWSWTLKSRQAWRSCRRGIAKLRRFATSLPGPGLHSRCPSPDSP